MVVRWVGVGVLQLVVLNLIILAAVTMILFRLGTQFGNAMAGAVVAIAFLRLQGFGCFGAGTYNFLTPYSHEMTHMDLEFWIRY